MPTLVEDFFTNPTGNLGTVKCFPWNVGGKALLLGDSAHAMVPFYGQGMNCSFEDCRVLDSMIEKHGTDWEKVFNEYSNPEKTKRRRDLRSGGRKFLRNARRRRRSGFPKKTRTRNAARTNISRLFFEIFNGYLSRRSALCNR